MRTETGYGHFIGGDPRRFTPDPEMCTLKEIERHAEACKMWNDAEAKGEKPTPESCPSGWRLVNGRTVHILRAPFGVGIYEYEVEDKR